MTSPDPQHTAPAGAAAKLALVVPAVPQPLVTAMDRLSLTQALLDVEVANARVLDLTARLVEANQRADALRADLEASRSAALQVEARAAADVAQVRADMAAHQAYLDEQRSSNAYRWAAKIWNLRNALRS